MLTALDARQPSADVDDISPPDIVYPSQKWTMVDKKKNDAFAIQLEAGGGFNMRSWNKVMGDKQLLPNMEI